MEWIKKWLWPICMAMSGLFGLDVWSVWNWLEDNSIGPLGPGEFLGIAAATTFFLIVCLVAAVCHGILFFQRSPVFARNRFHDLTDELVSLGVLVRTSVVGPNEMQQISRLCLKLDNLNIPLPNAEPETFHATEYFMTLARFANAKNLKAARNLTIDKERKHGRDSTD